MEQFLRVDCRWGIHVAEYNILILSYLLSHNRKQGTENVCSKLFEIVYQNRRGDGQCDNLHYPTNLVRKKIFNLKENFVDAKFKIKKCRLKYSATS